MNINITDCDPLYSRFKKCIAINPSLNKFNISFTPIVILQENNISQLDVYISKDNASYLKLLKSSYKKGTLADCIDISIAQWEVGSALVNFDPTKDKIIINRNTSSIPLVVFSNGAKLSAEELNKITNQAIHISEENAGSIGPTGLRGLTGLTGPAGPVGGTGTTGATGSTGAASTVAGPTGPAGQGFTYKGSYVTGTSYNPYDVVSHNGNAWITQTPVSVSEIPGEATVNPKWIQFVSKGSTGNTGATGPAGFDGEDGATGPPPWTFVGAYNNGLDYTYGDAVTYEGGFYYRTGNPNNPGYPPTVGAINGSWTPVADRGATGPTGPTGPSGLINNVIIALGGEASGNTSFNGLNNVTIPTTIPLLDGGNY